MVVASLLWLSSAHAQESGFTFRDNVIRVETADHWRGWDIAVGAATITEDGSVFPRFHRKRVNLALENTILAGSNQHLAHLAIDGDPDTAWEPDLNAPLEEVRRQPGSRNCCSA